MPRSSYSHCSGFHVREAGVEVANRGDQRGLLGQRVHRTRPTSLLVAGPVAAAADAGTGLHNRRDLNRFPFSSFSQSCVPWPQSFVQGSRVLGMTQAFALLVLAFLGPLPAHALARTA